MLAGAKLALLLVMGFGSPSKPGAPIPQAQGQASVLMQAQAPSQTTGQAPVQPSAQQGLPGAGVLASAAAPTGQNLGQNQNMSQTLSPAQAVQAVRAVILEESLAMAAQQAPAAAASEKKAQPAQPESVLSVQQIKARAEALDRQEQALKTLEADLNTRLAKLQALETLLKGMLTEAKSIKEDNMRHLIDVYSNMKAKQAASALEALDEHIAVKILSGMKGRQAGEVLSNVSAKKAAKLSEDLTKLQAGPNLPDKP
ncbi:MAG: hypothetical protein FD177_830 [Desulfovibrionaceae bacterium]|nr:MAG: hypothetical protein FD177_830 [Desulfovibrionaceae bacterium]